MVGLERPPSGTRALVVGLSAGLDSTVLLHLLCAARSAHPKAYAGVSLSVLHVNHGLQAAAEAFEQSALQTSAALGVPAVVVRARISEEEQRQMGLEAAARRARREAFAESARGQEGVCMVLAHHLDDQVETTLLQWMRGAGLEGLCGMAGYSPALAGRPYAIWRPLLQMPKAALADYAKRHELQWVEDPTNALEDFDRNRLRMQVLPVLTEMREGALGAMGRSIELLQEARLALEQVTSQDLLACRAHAKPDASFALQKDALLALTDARVARVLRAWIAEQGRATPPARRLEEFIRQLREASPGTSPQLAVRPEPSGGQEPFEVRLRAGILTLEPLAPSSSSYGSHRS